MFKVRDETKNMPGTARLLTAGRGVTGIEKGREQSAYWVGTVAEARKAVQENAKKRPDIIKIWVDDRDNTVPKLTPELYGAIIEEAHKQNVRVTAHIFDLEDGKGLLKANVDAFAHSVRDRDVDQEFLSMMKQRPNVTVNPNLPSPGKTWDISWLQGKIPADEYAGVQKANVDNPKQAEAVRHSSAQPEAAQRSGRPHRARHRRQHAVGSAPGDGGHGDGGHDADAGHRCLDGPRGRVPAVHRHRHASGGQERRPARARCESAGQHHQHTADQCGLLPRPDGEPQRLSELIGVIGRCILGPEPDRSGPFLLGVQWSGMSMTSKGVAPRKIFRSDPITVDRMKRLVFSLRLESAFTYVERKLPPG